MDDSLNIKEKDFEKYFRSLETNKLKELSQELKDGIDDDPVLIFLWSDVLKELSKRKKSC